MLKPQFILPMAEELVVDLFAALGGEEVKLVAALFVETDGAYFGLQKVDPWDESRDARRNTWACTSTR